MKTKITLLFLALSFYNINSQTLQWAKQAVGSVSKCKDVIVDASGNVYSTGTFTGVTDFDPGVGTFTMTSASSNDDVFILKLDASGNFVWAVRMGASSSDRCQSLALDASGNVYATGYFSGITDFDPGAGTFTLGTTGALTAFIWKLDASGNFVMAKNVGGAGESIAVDATGNIYTTGYFSGTADFDPGAGSFSLTSAGGQDNFISKLDASGNFVWAKGFGGTSTESSYGIAVDASGNVYTAGGFMGTCDFDPGAGTFTVTSAGLGDAYVSKLDASGNFAWTKTFGGLSQDLAQAITLDGSGNVYVTGVNTTGFAAKLDPAGTIVWSKDVGGVPQSIGLDGSGNVYTTGAFLVTTDFDPGAGTYTIATLGSYDIFLSKLDGTGNFVTAIALGGVDYDLANSLVVDGSGAIHVSGFFTGTADMDPSGTFTLTSPGSNNPNAYVLKLTLGSTPPTGFEEIEFENKVSVYPNPFISQLTFHVRESNAKNAELVICNSLGQVIFSETNFADGKFTMQRNNLPAGVYFYKLVNENKIISSGKVIAE